MTPIEAIGKLEEMNTQFVHAPRPLDEIIAALKLSVTDTERLDYLQEHEGEIDRTTEWAIDIREYEFTGFEASCNHPWGCGNGEDIRSAIDAVMKIGQENQ